MSGLLGAKKSTSKTESTVFGVQVQTSLLGKPLPLLFGTNRVAPNLMHVVGFRTIEHTESAGGGKGGSSGPSTTSYEYRASYLLGLIDGSCAGVGAIWRDKDIYRGGSVEPPVSLQLWRTPVTAGVPVSVPYASDFAANYRVWALTFSGDDYIIDASTYTISGGAYTFGASYDQVEIEYYIQPAPYVVSALDQAGITLFAGSFGQAPWSLLTASYPDQADGYSGISYLAMQDGVLDSGGAIPQYKIEMTGFDAAAGADANGADIIARLLSDQTRGLQWDSALYDVSNYRNYVAAAGLLISPCWDTQAAARDLITEVMTATNSDARLHDGVLQFVPLADEPVGSWTPDETIAYDITDDDLCPDDGEMPVQIERNLDAAKNRATIEFLNRDKDYAVDTADHEDPAAIDVDGLQPADVVQLHSVTRQAVAIQLVQIGVQRAQSVRATYTFKLRWRHMLLEPLDNIRLTSKICGLNAVPLRINSVEESGDDQITVVAEDRPALVGSAIAVTPPLSLGYQQDSNIAVGPVTDAVIVEDPTGAAATGLGLLIGATSADDNWGGCGVWVSYDGTTYQRIGQITAAARIGRLSAPMTNASTSMAVRLSGRAATMTSASSTAAASLATLCAVIDGDNTEYLAYAGATLTDANAYTLAGLVRGAYGTQGAAHSTGRQFVRIDDALLATGVLDPDLVGQTIYIKLTSFNRYGFNEQGLAEVLAIPYTVQGLILKLPPPDVGSFGVSILADGTRRFVWSTTGIPDDTPNVEIRYATHPAADTWASMTVLDSPTASAGAYETKSIQPGLYDFSARFVDSRKNYSVSIYVLSNILIPGAGMQQIEQATLDTSIEDSEVVTHRILPDIVVYAGQTLWVETSVSITADSRLMPDGSYQIGVIARVGPIDGTYSAYTPDILNMLQTSSVTFGVSGISMGNIVHSWKNNTGSSQTVSIGCVTQAIDGSVGDPFPGTPVVSYKTTALLEWR